MRIEFMDDFRDLPVGTIEAIETPIGGRK